MYYSRKKRGNVRIYDNKGKLAKALDFPVEDVKEEAFQYCSE
ncbi:hypothetical protein [Chryseobacterium sp. CP-77]